MIDVDRRPATIDDFYQTTDTTPFIQMVKSGKFENMLMFYGPPGVGKTTLARLLAAYILGLDDNDREELVRKGSSANIHGFIEYNFALQNKAADATAVGEAITDAGNNSAFTDEKYVFILDEFSELEPTTQKKLVKASSDHDYSNVYIIITLNNIYRVDDAIASRCKKFEFHNFDRDASERYLMHMAKQLGKPISKEIAYSIYLSVHNEASPRSLLLALDNYIKYGTIDGINTNTHDHSVVSNYLRSINEIAQATAKTNTVDPSLDQLYDVLYSNIERLIDAKKSVKAITQSLIKYSDSQLSARKGRGKFYTARIIAEALSSPSTQILYSSPRMFLVTVSEYIIREKARFIRLQMME